MTTDAERPVLDWCAQKTVVELIEEAKWAVTRWELYRRLYEALDEVQRQHKGLSDAGQPTSEGHAVSDRDGQGRSAPLED
jgi:hypothetical protein